MTVIRLKNILIVVSDIERSVKFYKDLFGLQVILNQGENVIMTEGLVLQEVSIWEEVIDRKVQKEHHASELYFEEKNLEAFIEKLEQYEYPIQYVNRFMEYSWGKKVLRFYDPDGNLIEVGTPM